MDASPHLLEITPPRRDGGQPAKLAIGVILFRQLFILALLVVLAVYIPIGRVFLGVWVLGYVFFGVLVLRIRHRQRDGVTQKPTLWLTSDSLGFTNARGITVSCARTTVTSAVRVFATVNRQTTDLLVFRDDTEKAVLTAPLGVWRPEDVDGITDALGIEPAGRKFVNSAAELETAVSGTPQPSTLGVSRKQRWIVLLAIYVIVIVVLVVGLVVQR
jgi:hypothetical protein